MLSRALTVLLLLGLAALMAWPWLDPPSAGNEVVVYLATDQQLVVPETDIRVTYRGTPEDQYAAYSDFYEIEGGSGWKRQLSPHELLGARLGPWTVIHAGVGWDPYTYSPGVFERMFGWMMGAAPDGGALVLAKDPSAVGVGGAVGGGPHGALYGIP